MAAWRARQEPKKLSEIRDAKRTAYRERRRQRIAGFLETQCGLCYLCGDPLILGTDHDVHLDHDPRCCSRRGGCLLCQRGLACSACNLLIGYARDDPERLRRIADNLETVRKVITARLK